jgi:hypothetical protein
MNQGRGILLAAVLCLAPLAGCSGDEADPVATDSTTSSGTASGSASGTTQASGTATSRSTVGATLVSGFPSDVVPVPPGTTVTSSAVEPTGSLTKVSLSGKTSLSVEEILEFYRSELTAKGFAVVDGNVLPETVPGLAFNRGGGDELLTLNISDNTDHRSFSIGGDVTT